jgi:hypothetical protein
MTAMSLLEKAIAGIVGPVSKAGRFSLSGDTI